MFSRVPPDKSTGKVRVWTMIRFARPVVRHLIHRGISLGMARPRVHSLSALIGGISLRRLLGLAVGLTSSGSLGSSATCQPSADTTGIRNGRTTIWDLSSAQTDDKSLFSEPPMVGVWYWEFGSRWAVKRTRLECCRRGVAA